MKDARTESFSANPRDRVRSRRGSFWSIIETRQSSLTIILLLLLAGVFCFLFLNRGALYYDEAIYAQVAKETVAGDHWITLHWNGQPWFHKPPLYFWITALLFKAFGPSEVLARALSALAGVGCVTLSYLIAKHLYDRTAGVLSGVILLTSALFVGNARQGMTDVLMTFFVLLAVYAYLKSNNSHEYWLVVGAACALAVLTKGVAGLLAPLIVVTSVVIDRRWQTLKEKYFWVGSGVFVILAISWHCILLAIHGWSFLDAYLFRHVIERSTSDLHRYNFGGAFYFSVLWNFVWPWVVFMPLSFWPALRRKHSKVLLVQVVLPFVLFSLAKTKFSWYAVPIVPALSILTAFLIRSTLERVSPKTRNLGYVAVALLAVIGTFEVVRHSKPDGQFQSVAQLSRLATKDKGAISSCPESLEMTVLYYSNRKLCVDPIVSPLSFDQVTKCQQGEIRHIIFQTDKRPIIESRFGPIRILAESNDVAYAEIDSQARGLELPR